MTVFPRVLDRTLNILTVCLLVAVAAGMIRQEVKPLSSSSHDVPESGTKLDLDSVDWANNHTTLLMVLRSNCQYCENSAAFHHALAAHPPAGIHIMAVFGKGSDTLLSANAYLSAHRIPVSDVRVAALSAVRARGTPTLELVDGTGHVVRSWLGELSVSDQQEVQSVINPGISWPSRAARRLRELIYHQ
jgi:thioredoxin-related protein